MASNEFVQAPYIRLNRTMNQVLFLHSWTLSPKPTSYWQTQKGYAPIHWALSRHTELTRMRALVVSVSSPLRLLVVRIQICLLTTDLSTVTILAGRLLG
jgi:hypothetical protein